MRQRKREKSYQAYTAFLSKKRVMGSKASSIWWGMHEDERTAMGEEAEAKEAAWCAEERRGMLHLGVFLFWFILLKLSLF